MVADQQFLSAETLRCRTERALVDQKIRALISTPSGATATQVFLHIRLHPKTVDQLVLEGFRVYLSGPSHAVAWA